MNSSDRDPTWWDVLSSKQKLGVVLGALVALAFFGLLMFRWTCVNFVDNYELGYKYDRRTGEITVLNRTGYFVTPPYLVQVHTVDLRPMQVCINANARVLNCKLVKFNPAGLKLFLSWHGRGDYDGGNSGGNTSTSGSSSGPSRFNQILMSYAYDGTGNVYPFLDILRELKTEVTLPK